MSSIKKKCHMKLYLIFLLCLVFPESGLSQNADGMISRPKDKSSTHNTKIKKENKNSNKVIFDFASDFVDGLSKVELNGKWGLIDTTGCMAISCKYEDVSSYISEGLIHAQQKRRCGHSIQI